MVSPLPAASLTPPHPPHPCVRSARLSSAPSAGGSGLSGTKEEASQELCAARWRKARLWTFGGEWDRTGNRGSDLFRIKSGLWGRAGSHGGVLCSLGVLTVPAFDIILSPGESYRAPHPSSHWAASIASLRSCLGFCGERVMYILNLLQIINVIFWSTYWW